MERRSLCNTFHAINITLHQSEWTTSAFGISIYTRKKKSLLKPCPSLCAIVLSDHVHTSGRCSSTSVRYEPSFRYGRVSIVRLEIIGRAAKFIPDLNLARPKLDVADLFITHANVGVRYRLCFYRRGTENII